MAYYDSNAFKNEMRKVVNQEIDDMKKTKEFLDRIKNIKHEDVKVIKFVKHSDNEMLFGGKCGGGVSHYINTEKISEHDLECPVCRKPLYIHEKSGVVVCSDSNCEYGHTH